MAVLPQASSGAHLDKALPCAACFGLNLHVLVPPAPCCAWSLTAPSLLTVLCVLDSGEIRMSSSFIAL